MEAFSPQSESLFREGYFLVKIEDEMGKIPVNKLIANNAYNQPVKDLLIRLLSLKEFNLEKGKVEEIVDSLKDLLGHSCRLNQNNNKWIRRCVKTHPTA